MILAFLSDMHIFRQIGKHYFIIGKSATVNYPPHLIIHESAKTVFL